ncbi:MULTISPECIES: mechanosensitive ion channel family protein [Marinobacter]|uniref:Mechanosensitive ion channel family protein n=1 Tax=Marinobacter suaedae TaxID=3057675 RepID=A0ABT8VW43_9GAMM|nr:MULTISPECIES: mechanosensitive ion channel family protein [unclassified Marinobacter]MBZ2168316.1 mechanosensitive ion channel family protein [Marinobacter sp. F4216]MDO3720212.1 mechanosensitive ion channel family protein [Marinobacter sp. chi1]
MFEKAHSTVDNWIASFGLLSQSWRVALVVFALVVGTATVAFLASRIIGFLERKFSNTKNHWDDALLHAVRKPVVAFVWLQGVYWAAEVAYRHSEAEIFKVNQTILEVGFIWLLGWFLLRLIRQGESILVSPVKMKRPMDYTTVNAVSKLARAAVIITVVLIAMQSLGYSISGVLAFGGVGGVAVGFAAKDLLANFFGGVIIHFDRPFKVGDWVRSPDRSIEGVVEHIGWRITTIRTFDKRPLYVPNAAFTTIAVENPSRMTNRRISETIGIRYADVNQMDQIVSDIKSMLQGHEEIDTNQTLIVNFVAFNASSLDIMVYTFTKTTDWVHFHEIKQDVLLKISGIIEGYGAEVAFPTRTLHLPDGVRLAQEQAQEGKAEGRQAQATESESREPASQS